MSAARLKHFGWGREGEGLTAEEEAFVMARAEARFGTAIKESATAPRRHESIRSMTGIIDRQRKPAGTWLTIASNPLHLTGNPAAPVTLATVRPFAV